MCSRTSLNPSSTDPDAPQEHVQVSWVRVIRGVALIGLVGLCAMSVLSPRGSYARPTVRLLLEETEGRIRWGRRLSGRAVKRHLIGVCEYERMRGPLVRVIVDAHVGDVARDDSLF